MDIERMKKLLKSGIEAGNMVKEVREVVKTYNTQKQDMYDDTSEILKPSIDAQKSVKESIDKKQDKVIEQLQENQKALAEGIGNIVEASQKAITFEEELPKAIEGPDEPKREPSILDVDNNFDKNDRIILKNYKLMKPKDLTQMPPQKLLEEREQAIEIAKAIAKKKGQKKTSADDKKSYDIELPTLRKYRETITVCYLHSNINHNLLQASIHRKREMPIRYHKEDSMVVWLLIFQSCMDISKLWLIKTARKYMTNKLTLTHLIF